MAVMMEYHPDFRTGRVNSCLEVTNIQKIVDIKKPIMMNRYSKACSSLYLLMMVPKKTLKSDLKDKHRGGGILSIIALLLMRA